METVNIAPGPDEIANIIRLIRDLYGNGQQAKAFQLLCAGWPHMKIGKAEQLLKNKIELGEALAE